MSSELNPYASPAPAIDFAAEPRVVMSTKYYGFRPAIFLTRGVALLLGLQMAVCLLQVAAIGAWYWDLGQHSVTGMEQERVDQHAAVQTPLEIAQFSLQLAEAVLFFVWLYRVQSNLMSLDNEQLEFTPGWAVGWFFIPFANLVKPYQVVREVWRASDPRTLGYEPAGWATVSSAVLVGWWWAFHLILAFASRIVAALAGNPETVEQYQQASLISMVGLIALDFPYLAIRWRLVHRIHQMQLARYARLLAALPKPTAEASPFA